MIKTGRRDPSGRVKTENATACRGKRSRFIFVSLVDLAFQAKSKSTRNRTENQHTF